MIDDGDDERDAISSEESRQFRVLIVLADHQIIVTILLVRVLILLIRHLVAEALDVAFVAHGLILLFSCRQTGPLDNGGRLELLVCLAFEDGGAVDRSRILVK